MTQRRKKKTKKSKKKNKSIPKPPKGPYPPKSNEEKVSEGNNAVTEAKLATNPQQGLAKAWVNFDGTGTLAIRDSFNVTSVTDNGTGDYTVNFAANALANANYCITASISFGTTQSRNILNVATTAQTSYTAPTTTALRLESVNYGNGNSYDANSVSIAVFGD